ncbi:MAG: hypothetical protein BGP06_12335 [Rhizobiales bacterium 65-9]|nr:MAG: hypothetical protein BGP06_12335 [Rhizobiales bacterium 65-9]
MADGVRTRADFADAQAMLHLEGRLLAMEDLVLHDAAMDRQAPGPDILRAQSYLDWRRAVGRRRPDATLTQFGLEPASAKRAAPSRPAFSLSEDEGEDDADPLDDDAPLQDGEGEGAPDPALLAIDRLLERSNRALAGSASPVSTPPNLSPSLERWRAAVENAGDEPAILTAAIALDAALLFEPPELRAEGGFLIAGSMLRQRGHARAHLPPLALGLRRGRFRWRRHDPAGVRLEGLVEAIGGAAEACMADLDRLAAARAGMLRRCAAKQRNSRLPDLIDLFMSLPLVTTAFAARKLEVSTQSIEAMLKDLDAAMPRELTGRRRYRAWGIV